MIPVQLTIKGLYSYKEEQTIDFETPMSAGLFGIFGGVGSGKSSLIEAILFVLYDRSDRLNKAGDNRYYNMLNLQSNELIIDFIFFAGDNHKNKYRFYFKAVRKKRQFEKVEVKDRSHYNWRNQKWQPLENVHDATDLLGMNYDNFRQTVIIPQGKFREFIDQKPTARTQMLKELFHLEQFDLSAPTGTLLSQTRLELSRTEGRLEELGPIVDDAMGILDKELQELKSSLIQKEQQHKDLQINEAQYLKLKVLFEKIKDASERLTVLQNDQELFQQRERQLTKYERAFAIFKEKLTHFFSLLEEMKQGKEHLTTLTGSIKQQEEKLKQAQNSLNKISKDWEGRTVIQQQCEDLKLLIAIKDSQERLDLTKRNRLKTEAHLTEQKKICDQYKKEMVGLEKKLLDQDQGELTELHQLHHWWEKQNEIKVSLKKIEGQLLRYRKQMDQLDQGKNALLDKLPTKQRKGSDPEIKKHLNSIKGELDKKINGLREQKNELQVKQELVQYSENMKDGQPCPLCGATHHPSVLKHHSVHNEIEAKIKAIDQIEEEKQVWQVWLQEYQQVAMEVASSSQIYEQQQLQQTELTKQKEQHQKAFQWKKYANLESTQVERMLQKAIADQEQVEIGKQQLRQLRKKINTAESQLANDQESWQTLNQQVVQQEAEISANRSTLKALDYTKYQNYPAKALQESLKKGAKQLEEIERKFQEHDQLVKQLRSELDRSNGQLQAEETSWKALEKKVSIADEEIKSLVKEHDFKDVQAVQKILALNLNITKERKDIESFSQELFALENSLIGLQREAGKKKYNEEKHLNLLHEIKQLDEKIQHQKDAFAIKNEEKGRLKLKLKQVKELRKREEQLSIRRDQLQVLAQLFKGQGFVNYVSTIYLQNLCQLANQRFFKLTQKNLSLELNENNEFIIRDYLNEGKTRLLKTLSGGQTFQAALCLALALAENVKSLNQSEQSFFFLDE
ncbi:MAG: AAA family ATPase, partial [Cyclobacteriaceae bacterium]